MVNGQPALYDAAGELLEDVENRFGDVPKVPSEMEWLIDNGSGYIAGETREFVADIGLKSLRTPAG